MVVHAIIKKIFLEHRESNPGQQVEKYELYRCTMPPLKKQLFLSLKNRLSDLATCRRRTGRGRTTTASNAGADRWTLSRKASRGRRSLRSKASEGRGRAETERSRATSTSSTRAERRVVTGETSLNSVRGSISTADLLVLSG